jgi:hypothetical protein
VGVELSEAELLVAARQQTLADELQRLEEQSPDETDLPSFGPEWNEFNSEPLPTPDGDEFGEVVYTDAEIDEAGERWRSFQQDIAREAGEPHLFFYAKRPLPLRAPTAGARPRERRPRRTRRRVRAGGSSRDGPSDPDPSDDELSGAAARRAA